MTTHRVVTRFILHGTLWYALRVLGDGGDAVASIFGFFCLKTPVERLLLDPCFHGRTIRGRASATRDLMSVRAPRAFRKASAPGRAARGRRVVVWDTAFSDGDQYVIGRAPTNIVGQALIDSFGRAIFSNRILVREHNRQPTGCDVRCTGQLARVLGRKHAASWRSRHPEDQPTDS